MRPRMSDVEIELFMNSSVGKGSAIEFGLGGSTLCMIEAGVGSILSVESDPLWITRISDHELVQPHLESGKLTICHADIGPTKGWGRPVDRARQASWPCYWQEPWRRVKPETVDMVFVDGRFRVACALNSILRGNRDMTILVHDFWNRSGYHVLLNYLNCACRADSLGVFFVKENFDPRAVIDDLMRFAFVVD